MSLTENQLCAMSLAELRAVTFRDAQCADDLVTLMRHWSSPSRELRAWHYIDAMLRSWVLLTARPMWDDYLSLLGLFYEDADSDDNFARDFQGYLKARYEGCKPLVIPRDVALGGNSVIVHGRSLDECPNVGVLAANGYHVGKSGCPTGDRRRILNYIMTSVLPDRPSRDEAARYGAAYSEQRLRRLAQVINTFRNSPTGRHGERMGLAIADWSRDLEYLRNNFHAGWSDFTWPEPAFAA